MSRSLKTRLAGTALCLVALLAYSCGGAEDGADTPEAAGDAPNNGSEDAEEFVVGTFTPLTGPGAAWGWAMSGAAEMAAETINEEGGIELDGVQHQIVIERLDTEYTPDGAVDTYNRLVNEVGAKMVVGPIGSAGGLAIKDQIEQDQIMALVGTYTPEMIDENTNYAFRVHPTNFETSAAMWRWLSENLSDEVGRLAVVAPTDETGRSGAQISSDAAADVGVETVVTEFYERGSEDFSAVIASLLANEPDVIDTATSAPGDAGLIMRQAREQGYEGRFIKTGGVAFEDIIAVSGAEGAEGMIMVDNADTRSEAVQEYRQEFEERYEVAFNGLFAHYHDAMLMSYRALQNVGTIDPDAWVEEMESMSGFEGPLAGAITWGGEETYGAARQIEAAMHLYEVTDGEQVHLAEIEVESP